MRTKEGNKREDIMNAAITEFARSGFHRAKVAAIAERANVATGSVYVYYKDKDSLLHEIFNDMWKKLYLSLEELINKSNISATDKYDTMIDMIFDTFTENPELAIVIINEQNQLITMDKEHFTPYYNQFIELGEKVVEEGIKKGIFSNHFNIQIFRQFLLGAFRDLVHSWAVDKKSFPLNSIRQNIKYLSKFGIMKN